jgi:recombination DNA repair RAD52 pathway protein
VRLTEEQVGVLLRPIAPHRVHQLDGNSYVEAYDIRAMLNRIFGFCGWSLIETAPAVCVVNREHKLRNDKPGVKIAYRAHIAIVIHTRDGDATYAGSSVGEATMPDYKEADAHDMALKSAESGALKRAASNLGDQFGLSLYRGGSVEALVKRVVGFNTSGADE